MPFLFYWNLSALNIYISSDSSLKVFSIETRSSMGEVWVWNSGGRGSWWVWSISGWGSRQREGLERGLRTANKQSCDSSFNAFSFKTRSSTGEVWVRSVMGGAAIMLWYDDVTDVNYVLYLRTRPGKVPANHFSHYLKQNLASFIRPAVCQSVLCNFNI